MTSADRPRFVELLAALGASFDRPFDTPRFEGYWLGLKDLPLADFEFAVGRALVECRFLPVPAELRELAGELRMDDRAALAWKAVEGAVTRVTGGRSVLFDDPVTTATILNLGGWQRLCETSPEHFDVWTRKAFLETYPRLARGGISAEACQPLVGYYDQANGLNGHGVEKPVLVQVGLPQPTAKRIAKQTTKLAQAQ